ncbi:MAG: DivIVA domain-containing protein [Brevibacterium sp.]|uniref:DivIVA domain-containing protein n=1 Tax=Brevibacterium TaxID=1696 RepID=UPI003F8A2A79
MPLWIVIGVAAAVFVLVFVVAATFNVFSSETIDEAEERWTGLPAEFTGEDLESVRFRPALRGYRMDDVDEAMSMLRARLIELESAAASDGPETAAGPR